MIGKVSKRIKNNIIKFIIDLLIIVFGIYSFIEVDLWNHLTGKYGFSVVTGNIFINTLEYLGIIMMITIIVKIIYNNIGGKDER